MTPQEFVDEFDESHFPEELGPELDLFSHDPPFHKGDLRKMAKLGVIVLDEKQWTYRLTLQATAVAHNDDVTGSEAVPVDGTVMRKGD